MEWLIVGVVLGGVAWVVWRLCQDRDPSDALRRGDYYPSSGDGPIHYSGDDCSPSDGGDGGGGD